MHSIRRRHARRMQNLCVHPVEAVSAAESLLAKIFSSKVLFYILRVDFKVGIKFAVKKSEWTAQTRRSGRPESGPIRKDRRGLHGI